MPAVLRDHGGLRKRRAGERQQGGPEVHAGRGEGLRERRGKRPLPEVWRKTWARDPDRVAGRLLVMGLKDRLRRLEDRHGGRAASSSIPLGTAVNVSVFRYNHCEDSPTMFSAVANRAKKVRSGKYGEYSPVGEA